VHVTGTMKWDAAQISDEVEGASALRREMGIDPARPLIVAGSTAPEEHALLHQATPPGVQLLCAPRRPEWFDQAAEALPGAIRRTQARHGDIIAPKSQRFLLDTIGELRQAYAIADLIIIGRSFGSLHGSDMMEPAALGKPVIVGPAVSDFRDTVDVMLAGDGIVQTNAAELPRVIADLLADPSRCRQLAINARQVIRAHQGATQRHVVMLWGLLNAS
jgi:3-deoxy-D-manno-octulosonic-acid transferase